MEQFNSKLYERYQILKKRKLSEEEELIRNREPAIKSYQQEVEVFVEELQAENERLRAEISELQEKYAESQKLVLEESQKIKDLSKEAEKLQRLLSEKNDASNSPLPKSPLTSSKVRSWNTKKGPSKENTPPSAMQAETQYEESISIPYGNCQEGQHVPDCCRENIIKPGNAMSKGQLTCVFQTLMELLVSMKLSLELQADGRCISAVHQRSGYAFSLTLRDGDGDGMIWYQVAALGTLERIALDWMEEEIQFSITMFSVFFERLKRVLGCS